MKRSLSLPLPLALNLLSQADPLLLLLLLFSLLCCFVAGPPANADPTSQTTESILTEQRFLRTSKHPFITHLYHSFHTVDRLFMIMEYCPGGELFTTIKKQPSGHLSGLRSLALSCMIHNSPKDKTKRIKSAFTLLRLFSSSNTSILLDTSTEVNSFFILLFLLLHNTTQHQHNTTDLKPENILLHLDGHIRMADFGLSKQGESFGIQIQTKEKKTFFGRVSILFSFLLLFSFPHPHPRFLAI